MKIVRGDGRFDCGRGMLVGFLDYEFDASDTEHKPVDRSANAFYLSPDDLDVDTQMERMKGDG